MDLGPVIFDLEGDSLTADDKALLMHPAAAGLILFARHCHNRQQVCDLVEEIRSVRPDCLIAIDQEGGAVQRLKEGVTRLPGLEEIGKRYEKDLHEARRLAEQHGWLMASEIRSCGIDISFAPVLDKSNANNPVIRDRAFSADVDIITPLAIGYIAGMTRAGMPATIKHFPGHGAVDADSHHALPHDSRGMAEIYEDMRPFIQLVEAGVQGVMPGHIVFDAIDSMPVGFSRQWLQMILRDQLGFEGAIISDDLSMQGAVDMGTPAERAQKALAAGCDYLLVCNNRAATIDVLQAIEGQTHQATEARRRSMKPILPGLSWEALTALETYQQAQQALEALLTREEDTFGNH